MARTRIDLGEQVQGLLSPSNINLNSSNRFVTDAEKSAWNGKAETDVVTTSVNGLMSAADKVKLNGVENSANNYSHPASHSLDVITETATKKIMTDAERSKLSGIEASSNNYSHPASHPPSIITEDTTHRFVTDAEKSSWNGKADTTPASEGTAGLMSAADKTKLDGIETSANNYSHPASHNASIINTDSTHRFVTDAEKADWNAKLDAAGGTVSGDLTVSGNLTINGTTTAIDTVNLEIEDNIMLLNKNQLGTPPTSLKSGLEVERGDSDNAILAFNESTDDWEVSIDGGASRTALALVNDSRFLTSGEKTSATREATSSQNGLMSSAYASKLDGVSANANNYSLPTATGAVKGGVKVGSNLNIASEVVTVKSATATQDGSAKAMQTETFTGNGSTTQVNISYTPSYLAVYLSGMRQKETDDYTISGVQITFVSAPKSGQKITIDYVPA